MPFAAAVLTLGFALVMAGCSDSADKAPDGWETLATRGVDVSFPASGPEAFRAQSDNELGRSVAAAAVRTEHDRRVAMISVQLEFTQARDPDGAATGAEAGVQLGSTLQGTQKISLNGDNDARRVDFDFTSTGAQQTPKKGTRVHGVILTGLDSKDRTFAVRIDAQKGELADSSLTKIIDTVTVH